MLKLSHYFKVPVDFFLDNTSAFLSEDFIANELDDEMLCKAIELLLNEAEKRKIYDFPLGNGKDKDYEQVIFKGNHNASIQS